MIIRVRTFKPGRPFIPGLGEKWQKIREKGWKDPKKIEQYNILQLQKAQTWA